MPKYSAAVPTWTPVAVADTTAMTDAGHSTIQGGTSTQRVRVSEIFMGGQATASAPTFMLFGRTSTVGATLTGARLALVDPSGTAPATAPTHYQTSTTKPQRSGSLGALLNLSFNAFGGVVRWVAPPDGEITLLGNSASLGELSLNAFTGGTPGLMGSHILLEVL